MASRLIVLATVLAAAQAGIIAPAPLAYSAPVSYVARAAPLAYATPITKVAAAVPIIAKTVVKDEYDPHPQYNFAYDIKDTLTGDSKTQHEVRDGDVVQGSYSLTDSDGFRRIVDYTADPIHGFNAVVRREPLVQKAIVTKTVAPVATYAAPVAAYTPSIAKIVAPVGYTAPVATKIYH